MKKLYSFLHVAFITFLFLPSSTYSHPGGRDRQGGHLDNQTGKYHFHTQSNQPSPAQPISEYRRDDWQHWVDQDKDCQDTRTEILIRDNVGTLKFKKNKSCSVISGKWICPYTGKIYYLATDMDIDHIVPLAHAHRVGGAKWSAKKKREFANDYMNLITTEDNINKQKGDQAPNEWKPPVRSYWPKYAQKWRAIKKKYELLISPTEESVLRAMEHRN